MSELIDPEPSVAEREAILAALGPPAETIRGEWAEVALAEGVESDEPDP